MHKSVPLTMFPLIRLLSNVPSVISHHFLYSSLDLFLFLLQVILKDQLAL